MSAQRIGGYVLVAVIAAAAGAAAVRVLGPGGAASVPAQAIDDAAIADLSPAEAEALRESRFASLTTIEDVLALPGEFAELEALYAIASRADAAELQNLLYQAARVGDPLRRDAFVRALLARLVELDPRTALAVAGGPLRRTGSDYTSFAWRQWARRDFDSALAEAGLSGGRRAVLAKALYEALPDLDDPRAADVEALLGVAPDAEARARILERAFAEGAEAALALLDGRAQWSNGELATFSRLVYTELGTDSLEWIERIASPMLRDSVRALLLQRLADDQPLAILDRLDGDDSADITTAIVQRALQALAASDPDAAFAAVERVRASDRLRLELDVLRTIAQTDAARALRLVEALRYAQRDRAIHHVAVSLMETDFDLALSMLPMMTSSRQQSMLLGSLARAAPLSRMPELASRMAALNSGSGPQFTRRNFVNSWASRDAEAALAWVQGLPESQQIEYLGSVLASIAADDPQRAVEMAMGLDGPSAFAARQQLVDSLVRQEQVASALAVANLITDDTARAALQTRTLTQLAARDPDRALALARSLGNAEVVDQVLSASLANLATRDPDAALARAREISDPGVRGMTERSVTLRAAREDPEVARRLIATLPEGAARDGALVGLATRQDIEVDEALRLTRQIGDDAVRQGAQAGIVIRLSQQDPAAANELADSLELPEHYRWQIDQSLRRGGVVFR